MEDSSTLNKEDEHMELLPGFRFFPTDEELITHYLSRKVLDNCFYARAIGEVDLNKCEPWDLPWRAKMGEKEWYFFCARDRKYPTGLRTNRATDAGYWKATGKDREIYRGKSLVGMKKTLVFYRGRAPKGEKTNWVMHEYRLEGKYAPYNLQKTPKREWVISRVFQKSAGGKKMHISRLARLISYDSELKQSPLLPLTDSAPNNSEKPTNAGTNSCITTISNSMATGEHNNNNSNVDICIAPLLTSSYSSELVSSASVLLPQTSIPSSIYFPFQMRPTLSTSSEYLDSIFMPDHSIFKQNSKTEFSQSKETRFSSSGYSVVTNHEAVQKSFQDEELPFFVDLDCLLNY